MDWKQIIPNKLALKISKQRKVFHYFSLGEIVDGTVFSYSPKIKYKAEVHVVDDPSKYVKGDYENFSSFYKVGDEWVYYERKYGGFLCQMFVQDLDSNHFKVYVNSFYINYVKAKVDSLYPVGIHITDILLCKMLRDNDLIVHGASLYEPKTKTSFLMVAPPDTGKTYTTYMLLKRGFKFLGEDLSYYDSSTDSLQCMPYTSTWGHRFKLQKVDPSKIPFVGLFMNTAKKGVEEIFGKESIKPSAKLNRIYLLEKSTGDKSIEKVKADKDLMRKVIAIHRNEFSYFKNPLLRAYEYCHDINIDAIYYKEASNFNKLFKTKELFVVRAPKYQDYEDMIVEHIHGG